MNDDSPGNIPAFDRISIPVVVVEDGADPSDALSAAGIFEPIETSIVLGDDPHEASSVLGDGFSPELRGVLDTGADEPEASGDEAATADGASVEAAPVTTAPPAFGLRSFAPVRPREG